MRANLFYCSIAGLLSGAAAVTPTGFNPYSYVPTTVQCPAVDRSGASPVAITLDLDYINLNRGAKKTIVMAHGWPSAWTTWRNQIVAFKEEYNIILPIFRGYGNSQAPADLFSSNTMQDVRQTLL
jgi:soluble epoxide hydrolase/lipid-phosphate phosphatase